MRKDRMRPPRKVKLGTFMGKLARKLGLAEALGMHRIYQRHVYNAKRLYRGDRALWGVGRCMMREMNSKRWSLAAVACGTFMATLDSSIVNIGLPTLTKELGTDLYRIKWVVIIYLLVVTCVPGVSGVGCSTHSPRRGDKREVACTGPGAGR